MRRSVLISIVLGCHQCAAFAFTHPQSRQIFSSSSSSSSRRNSPQQWQQQAQQPQRQLRQIRQQRQRRQRAVVTAHMGHSHGHHSHDHGGSSGSSQSGSGSVSDMLKSMRSAARSIGVATLLALIPAATFRAVLFVRRGEAAELAAAAATAATAAAAAGGGGAGAGGSMAAAGAASTFLLPAAKDTLALSLLAGAALVAAEASKDFLGEAKRRVVVSQPASQPASCFPYETIDPHSFIHSFIHSSNV